MGQGISAELFLPLRKVRTFDGWDGVPLLPFRQIIGVGRWVETHHLSLEGQNVLGDEWGLQEDLADNVLLLESLGLFDVSLPQFRPNKELLALADGCYPVSILRLLCGVDSEV